MDQQTWQEWIEAFEMIASACQWSDQAKLINLAMHLTESAYTFYRSCSTAQRSSYPLLTEALAQRFTPVNIQPVQSSLFHDRKQGDKESVNDFAQSLKCLFRKAYPQAQGSQEAEVMGRSVLSSQFVVGLRKEIKVKLHGRC